MKLLIGLGNPGSQYALTRHNAGFLVIDQFVQEHGGKRLQKSSFHGEIAEIIIDGEKVLCLKPMTFMNLSGKSVLAVIQFYHIEAKDCLILHDEIDFPFAKLQLKQGGSHAGHNGVKDIYGKCSGSQDFWRLRIGVGRPTHRNISSPPTPLPTVTTSSSLGEGRSIADYVLSNFSKEELPLFQADVMTKGLMMIEKWLKE